MKDFNNKLGHQGFSLIEILVALALMAVVFTIVPLTSSDDRSKLEESILDFDRAVKVATNEAILRNTVTRIFIDLEAEDDTEGEEEAPVKYSVQFGPSGGILLPKAVDLRKMGIKERENFDKNQKSFHSKFNSVEDYKDKTLPDGIEFLGVASSYQKEILTEGQLAIYFYPTGEKDGAIIFLASRNEIAYLEILAFNDETKLKYSPLTKRELEIRGDSLDNKLKDIHSQWLAN